LRRPGLRRHRVVRPERLALSDRLRVGRADQGRLPGQGLLTSNEVDRMTGRRRCAGISLAVAAAITAALPLAACDPGGTTPLSLAASTPASGAATVAPKTPP